jgi:hypothetical protein
MPALLCTVLMVAATLAGAAQGPVLALGTVSYLCGVLTLHYEVWEEYKRRLAAVMRTEPLYQGLQHAVTLEDDAAAFTAPRMHARFDYAAFTDAEVSHGLILGWFDNGTAVPVPVRAFASEGAASAFADDLRSRIAAARPAA